MKKVFIILLFMTVLFFCVGCDFLYQRTDKNGDVRDGDLTEYVITTSDGKKVNFASNEPLTVAIAEPNGQVCDASYETGQYCIYYFYLGKIKNLPFRKTKSIKCTKETSTVSFEFSETTSESISKTITESKTKSISTSSSDSLEYSMELSAGTSINKIGEKLGFKLGSSVSSSDSSTYSISNTTQFSKTAAVKEAISLTMSKQNGFEEGYSYRAVWYNTVDYYGIIIYDKTKGTYSATTEAYVTNPEGEICIIKSIDTNGNFDEWDTGDVVSFDVLEAVDYAKNHNCDNKMDPDGSEFNPYLISSWDELTNSVNNLEYNQKDKYWMLVKDITIPSTVQYNDKCIFSNLYAKIIGCENKITGMRLGMTNGSGTSQMALFEKISDGAEIKNVWFDNNKVEFNGSGGKNYAYAAILAIENYGKIIDCKFTNNVVNIDENSYTKGSHMRIGTIVVYNKDSGVIENCQVSGSKINGDCDTENGKNGTSCPTTVYAGGIASWNEGKVDKCQVKNSEISTRACLAQGSGDNQTKKSYAGGAVGYNESSAQCSAVVDQSSVSVSAKIKVYERGVFYYNSTEYNGNENLVYNK